MNPRFTSILLAVVMSVTACNQVPVYLSDDDQVLPAQPANGLVVDPESPIPDVPRPVGFVLVESRSRSYLEGGSRFIEHYYQGRAVYSEALSFYRRQPVAFHWVFQGERNDRGTFYLAYTKGRERLDIVVSHPRVTTVMVRVQSRNTARAGTPAAPPAATPKVKPIPKSSDGRRPVAP